MAHDYIDWYSVKDPHPAALPNLQTIVTYMINNRHTHNLSTITLYRMAKVTGRHPKQINNLIVGRPGFVLVMRDGKSQGYYWDNEHFGEEYPINLSKFKGKRLLSVEDIQTAIGENAKEIAATLTREANNLKEARKPSEPDYALPFFTDQEVIDRTARFSKLPNEIARDLVQTSAKIIVEDGLNQDALIDMATALFSLLEDGKRDRKNK